MAGEHITGALVVSGRTLFDTSGNIAGVNETLSGNQIMTGATAVEIIGSAAEGGALTLTRERFNVAAIADTVATTFLTITVPNVTTRAMFWIRFSTGFDAAPINDSARVGLFVVNVTRRVGLNAVATLTPVEGSNTNPVTNVNQLIFSNIATLAAGATFTTVIAAAAVGGGVTASNTVALTIANTASAGSPTTSIFGTVEGMNQATGGASIA